MLCPEDLVVAWCQRQRVGIDSTPPKYLTLVAAKALDPRVGWAHTILSSLTTCHFDTVHNHVRRVRPGLPLSPLTLPLPLL